MALAQDLISFKAFLEGSETHTGNYVSASVANFGPLQQTELAFLDSMSGKKTPELHCTLVYSPTTDVAPEVIQSYLDFYWQSNKMDETPQYVSIIDVAKFDAPQDKDGNRPDASTLVLKLGNSFMDTLHTVLVKEFNLKHTYETLSPHVSLRYGLSHEDCEKAMGIIQPKIGIRSLNGINNVQVLGLHSARIIKDWAN